MIRLKQGAILVEPDTLSGITMDGTLNNFIVFAEMSPYETWAPNHGMLVQIEQDSIDIEGLPVSIPPNLRILGSVKYGVCSILSCKSVGIISQFSPIQPFFAVEWAIRI